MATFFVSMLAGESEVALRTTLESLRRYGKIVLHVDKMEDVYPWSREYVEDVVAIKGVGAGRSWALENLDDDYICTADSHIYLHSFAPDGFEDALQFDFGPDVEHAPWTVMDRAVKHHGVQNWNRRCSRTFPFSCDVVWYSVDPFVCFPRYVVKALRDLYGRYGMRIVPWPGYGAEVEQAFVSATRLFGPARCSTKTIYGHRHNLAPGFRFWSERWKDKWYSDEWFQANTCFLKLHYPKQLWRYTPFDPTTCRYVSDDVAERIQDEFRYGYRDFLRWVLRYAEPNDRKIFEEEAGILGI